MRGGLDDALDRLARRDELRRRAAGEANGTPPAVTELVEAIAGVVGRNAELAVTVGVEGAGDPVLLHFAVEDGIVQVRADNTVVQRAPEPAPDDYIDIDIEEAEAYTPPHGYAFGSPVGAPAAEASPAHNGHGYSEPAYEEPAHNGHGLNGHGAGPGVNGHEPAGFHRYEEPAPQPEPHPFAAAPPPEPHPFAATPPPEPHPFAAAPPPERHPFAATPPPEVPPQTTRRIHPEQHRAPQEPSVPEPPRSMPTPLPEPVPLRVNEEETDMAAKRLAALLREDPSLLRAQD